MLLLTLSLLCLLPLTAKDGFRYRSLTMNDGLAANAVRNIVQDSYGFIWFGTDNGLCRYDGTQIQSYRINELGINQYVSTLMAAEGGLYVGTDKGVFRLSLEKHIFEKLPMNIHSTVTSIDSDKDGNLWVSTIGDGIWQYVPRTKKTKHYGIKEVGGAVAQVLVDSENKIWTVTNWGETVMQRLNRLHDRFEPVSLTIGGEKLQANYGALRMLQTKDGRIWLGTWEKGLLLVHGDGQLEQMLSPTLSKVGSHIHTLYQRSDDCICIGCDDGLISFNPKTRAWERLLEQGSLADRFVYAVTSDSEGGLWIGTFYGGVTYISPVSKRFDAFSIETGLRGNVISHFCEDKYERIWIASDDGGLMCYSPRENRFIDYPHQDVLGRQNAHALSFSGDELWIGTYTNGVQVLNIETGALRQYTPSTDPHSLDNPSCYALYTDERGWIWVGTMDGLNLYNREANHFERIGKTNAMIIDIDEDRKGNIWITTQGGGLWRCGIKDKKLKQYLHDDNNRYSLPDNQVNCTLVDESGWLWIGTLNGLCCYDAERDRFDYICLDVPNRNIMSIIENNGVLWLSTDHGIVSYEPGAKGNSQTQHPQTQRFTLHDGLVSEQFQPNSGLKTKDGRIYFGSTTGFNAFYPYQIKANSVIPPVYITSMSILNHEEYTAEGLPVDLSLTKELTLGYSDAKMITFSFASLSYCSPEKNQYAYMLEGFDRDWNYVGNQNRATYTNIPAGTYLFRVKATNNDGVWSENEATLRIVVHPPFWWSWYAKIIYLLLSVIAVWYYVRFRLKRAEHRHQLEIQKLNEKKDKEVREARLNFFTMIAHEIRTPVSLIIGPLEKMMKSSSLSILTKEESGVMDDLKVIDRNARRLLELVNQLLDFRKVEQQSMVMRFAPQNVHELMENISVRFAPTFEQGGKRFMVDYPDEHFTAMIDREAITKVISNLLTNANKYTKDEVRLSCITEPDGEHFRIIVADNGIGIREEDCVRLFEPFFQAQGNKPGTGIGLNIVKNIVDLHHGTISVESEVGRGSKFIIVLPVGQDVVTTITDKGTTIVQPHETGDSDSRQSIFQSSGVQSKPSLTYDGQTMLLVDDSEDMVSFLKENFRGKYNVVTAGDGFEALDLLQKYEVNIIISDWMMPRMDGSELCRRVRLNPQTSHIPFIMLTAKTDDDSKVESMDMGADTYIEKPFSLQYLEACIRNILQMRRRLMEKFSTQPLEPVTEIASNPTDNEFLLRMNKIIEENFSNSDLNVNFLADKLNISRSGLFAKIKTLADVTPNEMIQIIRLKRAAQLLHSGQHTISEVGYMVGFSNPSYFSKCFLKQFGIRPADYVKSSRNHV